MNRITALSLLDILMSEASSPVEKHRAEAQLRELIRILLPENEEEEQP